MGETRPTIIILAGPNGAGKSTAATVLLPQTLATDEWVNADDIARELSPHDVDDAAIQAGRLMLGRLRELAKQRVSFGFETTLASRSFAPWLRSLKRSGYWVQLLYLWLESDEIAIRRVATRVLMGGHTVPSDVIRRRYWASLRNFFALYRDAVSGWRLYDANNAEPRLVATCLEFQSLRIYDVKTWTRILEQERS